MAQTYEERLAQKRASYYKFLAGCAHDVGNIVPACKQCNGRKHNTPLLIWMFRQKIMPEISGGYGH
jgi:hypothetical protein